MDSKQRYNEIIRLLEHYNFRYNSKRDAYQFKDNIILEITNTTIKTISELEHGYVQIKKWLMNN